MSILYYPSCRINANLTANLIKIIFRKCQELKLVYYEISIGKSFSTYEQLDEQRIDVLFHEYNPNNITIHFKVNDTYVGFSIKQKKPNQCYVDIGGELIDIKKSFIILYLKI